VLEVNYTGAGGEDVDNRKILTTCVGTKAMLIIWSRALQLTFNSSPT